jgi:hypothetical protein
VRYAGRSGCCAAIDQIVFDVPANVAGCFLPVVAVANGVTSNVGTIAVSNSGRECDDPLSFRGADLGALQRNGRMRVGSIVLWNQTPAGAPLGSTALSGSFVSYTPQSLMGSTAAVNPSAGTCYMSQTPVETDTAAASPVQALNAGFNVMSSGPAGALTAEWVSPGQYQASATPSGLPAGVYTISGSGGPDIGAIHATLNIQPGVQWTNAADFPATIRAGQPMTFRWTGGDRSGFVVIRIHSANVTLASSIVCNVPATPGAFTVPDYLTRGILQGRGSISVGSFGAPGTFSATGLDVGMISAGASTVLETNFQSPPVGMN